MRAVSQLAKSKEQLHQHQRRAKEVQLSRQSERLGRFVLLRGADGRLLEHWQHGFSAFPQSTNPHPP